MRLVHEAKLTNMVTLANIIILRPRRAYDDPGVATIFRGQLGPETIVLIVGRSALTNNGPVPPRVVMLKHSTEPEPLQSLDQVHTTSAMTWAPEDEDRAA